MAKSWIVAFVAMVAWVQVYAALIPLVRQYVIEGGSGTSTLVCVYGTPDNLEVEHTYPVGNFCPKYAEA